ncbi:DUF4357 domain-containing protein [Bergeyella zoohelcum]|uniref:Recombination protein F n=1 Tax=Bergeyella zoohelcum TaxID=1015 RepID=A0A380ZUK5_9FLAO|nr:DUF4357 domain-containing protein [Bergeyella zoohelcum]EKB59970.1 hypothetical protein HMPREF9700_01476 [Bergeyella zoohelcum CCUG 30536]SUV52654.1 recombination protein F [Bergeyella zoohelcum]
MRIKSLKIVDKAYKNLDITLDDNTSGIMAFIGNNGSGKSNVLEAISIIFKYLYQKKDKNIPFDFLLTYEIGGGNLVEITKSKTTVITKINGTQKSDPYNHLPKQVVAIYSGEEDRLWRHHYEPIYKDFISRINKDVQTEMPKMLYLNKYYWHISLLCLLLNRSNNPEDTFCEEILGINKVHSVKFEFNKNIYQGYKESNVLQFISTIHSKDEYTLEDLQKTIKNYDISDIFKYLYIAFTPNNNKILQNITIKYNDENLEIEDFSEGEKKMLLIKSALEFAGQEDSLFILDEPDAHIHLGNKIQIQKVLLPYQNNRQVIITTHSPTLTKAIPKESVWCLEKGKVKELQNIAEVTKYLANREDIYKLLFSESNILIVEGKTDDKYIKKAIKLYKDEFPNLDFQILRVGGTDEENIKNLIDTINLKDEQKIIVLIDRDEAGYKVYKTIFNNNKDKKYILSERYSNNIYFLMIPHKEINNNDKDFVIEDYFKKTDIERLLIDYLRQNFIEKNTISFKSFPKISNILKQKLLPRFCEDSNCTKENMEGFKVLLAELNRIISPASTNHIDIFTNAKNTDITACFYPDTEKVIVKKGSKIVMEVVPSFNEKTAKERKKELQKIAKEENRFYILNQDKEFDSPSGAIAFVLGANLNGWKFWKIKENQQELTSLRNK